jgi:hypothetical protein
MRPRIRSYEEAARFLGTSSSRGTGQRGTRIVRLTETEVAVRYHNTDVVVYHHPIESELRNRVATISTGGWLTKTTVDRINEYAPEGSYVWRDGDGSIWAGNGTGRSTMIAALAPSLSAKAYIVERRREREVEP